MIGPSRPLVEPDSQPLRHLVLVLGHPAVRQTETRRGPARRGCPALACHSRSRRSARSGGRAMTWSTHASPAVATMAWTALRAAPGVHEPTAAEGFVVGMGREHQQSGRVEPRTEPAHQGGRRQGVGPGDALRPDVEAVPVGRDPDRSFGPHVRAPVRAVPPRGPLRVRSGSAHARTPRPSRRSGPRPRSSPARTRRPSRRPGPRRAAPCRAHRPRPSTSAGGRRSPTRIRGAAPSGGPARRCWRRRSRPWPRPRPSARPAARRPADGLWAYAMSPTAQMRRSEVRRPWSVTTPPFSISRPADSASAEVGAGAAATDHGVGGQGPAADQIDPPTAVVGLRHRRHAVTQHEHDVGLQQPVPDPGARLVTQASGVRQFFVGDQDDLGASAGQAGRRLTADEARADHDDVAPSFGDPPQRLAAVPVADVDQARQVATRDRQRARRGAGRQSQLRVPDDRAVGQRDPASGRVDRPWLACRAGGRPGARRTSRPPPAAASRPRSRLAGSPWSAADARTADARPHRPAARCPCRRPLGSRGPPPAPPDHHRRSAARPQSIPRPPELVRVRERADWPSGLRGRPSRSLRRSTARRWLWP